MEKLGFGIVGYACTTCNGMSGALDSDIQQEIIDETYIPPQFCLVIEILIAVFTRTLMAFLASPPLVVAYALAGTIRFDIERDALGYRSDGQPIYLSDLWPSDEEIDQTVAEYVKPEQFKQVYIQMFKLDDQQANSLILSTIGAR